MNVQINNIILTGFRATGKTSVGQILAAQLQWSFLDTDALLCQRLGASIADIVARHGWAFFRQAEGQLLRELATMQKTVLATGGGAIEHLQEWQDLRKCGLVVWLEADLATIRLRLREDSNSLQQRPSITGHSVQDEIAELLERRRPLYAAGSDLRLATADKSPEMLAQEIQRAMIG